MAERRGGAGSQFPASCVMRRDVEDRQADGVAATELPRPGLGGALSPAPEGDARELERFMEAVLGEGPGAAAVADGFSRQVQRRFGLDGVGRRAWWLSPGRAWAPRGDGAEAEAEAEAAAGEATGPVQLSQTVGVRLRAALLLQLRGGGGRRGDGAARRAGRCGW